MRAGAGLGRGSSAPPPFFSGESLPPALLLLTSRLRMRDRRSAASFCSSSASAVRASSRGCERAPGLKRERERVQVSGKHALAVWARGAPPHPIPFSPLSPSLTLLLALGMVARALRVWRATWSCWKGVSWARAPRALRPCSRRAIGRQTTKSTHTQDVRLASARTHALALVSLPLFFFFLVLSSRATQSASPPPRSHTRKAAAHGLLHTDPLLLQALSSSLCASRPPLAPLFFVLDGIAAARHAPPHTPFTLPREEKDGHTAPWWTPAVPTGS